MIANQGRGLRTYSWVKRNLSQERDGHIGCHPLSSTGRRREDLRLSLSTHRAAKNSYIPPNDRRTSHYLQTHLTKPLMFSTTPRMGRLTFRQKFTSFLTSCSETSCTEGGGEHPVVFSVVEET